MTTDKKTVRLTIMVDPARDRDIISDMKGSSVSQEGRRMLRLAMFLKRAKLDKHLAYLLETGVEEDKSPVEIVKMALNLTETIGGKSNDESSQQDNKKNDVNKKPLKSAFSSGAR